MKHFLLACLLLCTSLLNIQATCNGSEETASNLTDSIPERPDYPFTYDLENPDQTMKLPDELNEISGISLSPDGKQLLAVQDEDGIIFTVDKKSEKIVEETEFWKDGDYEDLATVGNDVFVLKSTGTIYQVKNFGKKEQEVEKYNEFLDGGYDVEGMTYDTKHQRLLLTCKSQGEAEKEGRYKAVYAFNLVSMQFETHPALLISQKSVDAFLEVSPTLKQWDKIVSFFDPSSSIFALSPSAIAVHPITEQYYILSSVGKMLVITDRDGTVLHIEKLDKDIHRQPEGICFEPDGTMYISNEGKSGTGRIYRFNVKDQ